MKKLLIAISALTIAMPVFAEKTEVVTFDSSSMKCGARHVDDGIQKDQLKAMHCKKFQDKKTDVVFMDDNSHKVVDCKVNHDGSITLAKCTSI